MSTEVPAAAASRVRKHSILRSLLADRFAFASAVFLVLLLISAVFGPVVLADAAGAVNLRARNLAPFAFDQHWSFVFGADSLGRSVLARLLVGARTTLIIAGSAVLFSMIVGGCLGLVAGYARGALSQLIMRLTDVVMSFPSLLLALVVLYLLGPSIFNVIVVLAITRVPIYLRTTRAEVLEIRERTFVTASQTLGAGHFRLLGRHILPLVLPTLLTIAAIDFAAVILAESALSFLGFGVQLPDFTWGSMVATGQSYLTSAWWISFFPGLAILLTTLSLNLLGSWVRIVTDPQQRWRLAGKPKSAA